MTLPARPLWHIEALDAKARQRLVARDADGWVDLFEAVTLWTDSAHAQRVLDLLAFGRAAASNFDGGENLLAEIDRLEQWVASRRLRSGTTHQEPRARATQPASTTSGDAQGGRPRSTLTTDQARDVLRHLRGTMPDAALARMFGLTADQLRRLCAATPSEQQAMTRRNVRGTR